MVPNSDLPENMVITYNNWSAKFDSKQTLKLFHKTKMGEKGITMEDIQGTLGKASEVMLNYRGKFAYRTKIVKIALAAAGLVFLIIAVSIGMNSDGDYVGPMFIVLTFLLICLIVILLNKYRSSYQMRMS